jgi:uncharacterized protein (TIGR02145 family)
MKISKIILFISATVVFFSCGTDVNELSEEGAPVPLSIVDASLTAGGTRAATTLSTSGDAIGLFLAAGTPYSAVDNVKYAYTTAWAAASTAIYLTKSTASLCAYYPYVDGATVSRTLAPTVYSAASDLCYKSGLSASSTANSLSFEMGHAYSKLTMNISKGTYPGTGAISSITFANDGLITSSTLNISTGAYTTGATGVTYTDAAPAIASLSTTATKQYLMVPCTLSLSGDSKLTLVVDGISLSAVIPNATLGALVAGSNHTLNITLSGTALVVSSVSTTDWVEASSYLMTTDKTANSYIVAPSSSLEISVGVKGNGEAISADLASLSVKHTADSVGVLWQTSAGLVTVSGFNATTQQVTVTAGTASGNAVIAAYDASSNILWSWHIWVTSYDPDTKTNGTTYSYTNTSSVTNVFMDRNLGATSVAAADVNTLGLLYQWGRKDPFVGPSAYNGTSEPTLYNASGTGSTSMITKTAVSATSNVANSILYPLTYYCGTSANQHDWYSVTASTHNDALWGGAAYGAAKTIFDPCPAGWRVPSFYKTSTSVFSWLGLGSYATAATYWSTNGYQWTTTPGIGFWPAAGYRNRSSGTISNAGSYSYYWSASPNGEAGYNLYFYSGYVLPSNSDNRAWGMSVRCVQEW